MLRHVIYYKNKLCDFIFFSLADQLLPPVTSSLKLLPLEFSNKCCKFPLATSEDEHQSIRKS